MTKKLFSLLGRVLTFANFLPCGVRCLSRQAGRRGPNTSCCRAGSAAADEQGETVHRCQRFELAPSNRRPVSIT